MQQGKAFLLNIFTFNYLQEYLVENPIQALIILCHNVFVWFTKRAWAACDCTGRNYKYFLNYAEHVIPETRACSVGILPLLIAGQFPEVPIYRATTLLNKLTFNTVGHLVSKIVFQIRIKILCGGFHHQQRAFDKTPATLST